MKTTKLLFILFLLISTNIYSDMQEDKKACEKGNSEKCQDLGLQFAKGEGILRNVFKANEYYQKACDLDNANGCRNLGMQYYSSVRIEDPDSCELYVKASNLFEKACNLNDRLGCMMLGLNYKWGKGVSKDIEIAKKYLKKSCELKLQSGCDQYAELNKPKK